MTLPSDPADKPLAEPGKHPQGADVGGMRSSADGGLGDALQRSVEHGDEDAIGTASIGDGSAGGQAPRLDRGGKAEPGSASAPRTAAEGVPTETAGSASAATEEDDPPWRHEPVVPKDKGLADSLGRSISEVVTGPLADKKSAPKT